MTKKINYNNPTFWASIKKEEDNDLWFCSKYSYGLRIIYSDGACVYADEPELDEPGVMGVSCFYKSGMTHKQTIKAMKEYDKENNRTTIYLGQIVLKGEE